jgi:hypothetical protein
MVPLAFTGFGSDFLSVGGDIKTEDSDDGESPSYDDVLQVLMKSMRRDMDGQAMRDEEQASILLLFFSVNYLLRMPLISPN